MWNPHFIDWEAYNNAVYQPAPQLRALPDYDSFWRTMGGDGWGFGDQIERQRAAYRQLKQEQSNG